MEKEKQDRRSRTIEVYMTTEEKTRIKKSAADANVSLSEYCLKMILSGHVVAPITPEHLMLLRTLSGIANNLNQAVKKMHQEKGMDGAGKLMGIIDKIDKILP